MGAVGEARHFLLLVLDTGNCKSEIQSHYHLHNFDHDTIFFVVVVVGHCNYTCNFFVLLLFGFFSELFEGSDANPSMQRERKKERMGTSINKRARVSFRLFAKKEKKIRGNYNIKL